MAADDLTDEEAELIKQHRARNRPGRKVRVYGDHDGGSHEFELEGDEADAVVQRHAGLWKSPEPAQDEPDGKDKSKGKPKAGTDADGVRTIYGRRVS